MYSVCGQTVRLTAATALFRSQSIWTIDLAHALATKSIKPILYTAHAGVNERHSHDVSV
jgi:hypothetical protein